MKIEYEVVTGATHNIDVFKGDVETYLNDGWKLSGGITINSSKNTNSAKLYQAIYREVEE
jgi:hypothetical protein